MYIQQASEAPTHLSAALRVAHKTSSVSSLMSGMAPSRAAATAAPSGAFLLAVSLSSPCARHCTEGHAHEQHVFGCSAPALTRSSRVPLPFAQEQHSDSSMQRPRRAHAPDKQQPDSTPPAARRQHTLSSCTPSMKTVPLAAFWVPEGSPEGASRGCGAAWRQGTGI